MNITTEFLANEATAPPEAVQGSSSKVRLPRMDRVGQEVISSRIQVLEAALDLYDQGLEITRSSLVRHTGLKTVTVDDCIKELKRREEIVQIVSGVYRPVFKHPPARAISRTTLPDGTVKIEVGDEVLTLTPKESRMLGEAMGGSAAILIASDSAHRLAEATQQIHSLALSAKQLLANSRQEAVGSDES